MRADTEQLRKAEEEMISQFRVMNLILTEADEVRVWLQRDSSLDEFAYRLRRWEDDFGRQMKQQSAMSMALDNVCRIYEAQETKIMEAEEQFGTVRVARAFPGFSELLDRYRSIVARKIGGS